MNKILESRRFSMNAVQQTYTNRMRVMWLAVGLAVLLDARIGRACSCGPQASLRCSPSPESGATTLNDERRVAVSFARTFRPVVASAPHG